MDSKPEFTTPTRTQSRRASSSDAYLSRHKRAPTADEGAGGETRAHSFSSASCHAAITSARQPRP